MELSGLEQGTITIAFILVLMGIGIPVAVSMIVVAGAAMWYFVDINFMLTNFRTLPYTLTSNYTYVVVPMFVLMGELASKSGIISDLYMAAHRFTSRIRGGLFMSTILASAGFGAASGSTVVSASVFTKIALPEMKRFKYNLGVSAGCIAASGTLAALIPPSIAMVILAVLTDQSIGALLMAGVVPGLLTAAFYMGGAYLFVRLRPSWAPMTGESYTWREKLQGLRGVWAIMLLATVVIGGLYFGVFAPSAAGAAGAAGAALIAFLSRRLTLREFWASMLEAARITTVLFLIFIGGMLLSRALLVMGFIDDLNDLIAGYGISAAMFIALVIIIYFVLGMFVDSISIMVITLPFMFPISQALEINAIWFSVLLIKLVEIAAITPPVGLNLYAVQTAAAGEVNSRQIFLGVLPFVATEIVLLAVLIMVPEFATWLPDQMRR